MHILPRHTWLTGWIEGEQVGAITVYARFVHDDIECPNLFIGNLPGALINLPLILFQVAWQDRTPVVSITHTAH